MSGQRCDRFPNPAVVNGQKRSLIHPCVLGSLPVQCPLYTLFTMHLRVNCSPTFPPKFMKFLAFQCHLGSSAMASSTKTAPVNPQAQGKAMEAEPLFRQALVGCEEKLGDRHPHTLTLMNNLAGAPSLPVIQLEVVSYAHRTSRFITITWNLGEWWPD